MPLSIVVGDDDPRYDSGDLDRSPTCLDCKQARCRCTTDMIAWLDRVDELVAYLVSEVQADPVMARRLIMGYSTTVTESDVLARWLEYQERVNER